MQIGVGPAKDQVDPRVLARFPPLVHLTALTFLSDYPLPQISISKFWGFYH